MKTSVHACTGNETKCIKHSHHLFKNMGADEHTPVTFQLMHYCNATPPSNLLVAL